MTASVFWPPGGSIGGKWDRHDAWADELPFRLLIWDKPLSEYVNVWLEVEL